MGKRRSAGPCRVLLPIYEQRHHIGRLVRHFESDQIRLEPIITGLDMLILAYRSSAKYMLHLHRRRSPNSVRYGLAPRRLRNHLFSSKSSGSEVNLHWPTGVDNLCLAPHQCYARPRGSRGAPQSEPTVARVFRQFPPLL